MVEVYRRTQKSRWFLLTLSFSLQLTAVHELPRENPMSRPAELPVPPVDAVMPHTAMLWFGGASVVLSAFCFAAGLHLARRERRPFPLLLPVAGMCTVVLEATVCHLGHCWHPVVGQWTLYTSNGVSVPVYLAFSYCFYFSGLFLVAYPLISKGRLTGRHLWRLYGGGCVMASVVEIYVMRTNLWIYYGPQALWLWKGTLPLWWVFTNVACILLALTLVAVFYPVLTGWKQLLVLPLSPLGAYMGHLAVGAPYYLLIGSNAGADQTLVELSGIASLALALLVVAGCGHVLTLQRRITSHERANPAAGPEPAAPVTAQG
jgi:hypothetical protein